MKKIFIVFVAVVLLCCAVQLTNRNFGAFYWSQTRYENQQGLGDRHCMNYFITADGKIKQYNYWVADIPYNEKSNFPDEHLVGFGWYHHSDCS